MSIVAILLLFFVSVDAQYPYIQPGDTADIGQCMSNFDCDVYLHIFPYLNSGDIQCYQPYMKCISPKTGKILATAFDIPCPPSIVTLTSIVAYPSIDCIGNSPNPPSYGDGIVQVDVTANPPQRIKGLLRLYRGSSILPTMNDTYDLPYQEQIYTNYPQLTYTFNQLISGVYQLIYFDITGCSVFPSNNMWNVASSDDGSGQSIPYVVRPPCDSTTRYLPAPPPNGDLVEVQNGVARALRVGFLYEYCIEGPWSSGYIHTSPAPYPSGDSGVGQRVPVINIFGSFGELLASYSGTDTCIDINGTGGGTIPIYSRFSTSFYPTVTPTSLAQAIATGYAIISFGFGYAYRSTPLADVSYLYYDDGSYRGSFLAPRVVDMTNTSFARPATTSDVIQPYFPLGPFTNTQIMYGTNYFAAVDLYNNPIITVVQDNTNYTQSTFAVCYSQSNPASTTATITADYRGLKPVPGTAITLQKVIDGQLVPFNPPLAQVVFSYSPPLQFTVSEIGTYCLVYVASAFDGLGVRPLLYSCFVFGTPTAWLLQTNSYLVTTPYTPGSTPVPYATFRNSVATTFIVGFPALIITNNEMIPRITLTLFSPDDFYESHLQQIDATFYSVFNNQRGSWDISVWYTVIPVGNTMTLYILNVNIETKGELVVNTIEGDSSVGAVAMSNFQLVNTTYFDYYDVTQNTQYQCSLPTSLNMMELFALSVSVSVQEPICPNEYTVLTLFAEGGVCYHMLNPVYLNNTNNTNGGVVSPYTTPCGYYFRIQNFDPTSSGYLTILGAQLGLATWNVPTNTVIRVIANDASSNVIYTIVRGDSAIPEDATVITFSQQISCVNGTQMTNITFYVTTTTPPVNDTEIITYWTRTDLTTNELYDPNDLFFDLPQDCPLLDNMTIEEVYYYCHGGEGTLTPTCLQLCLNLPPFYPDTYGQSLVTSVDGQFWDAVAWVPSGYINPDTNRSVYCRTGNSIRTDVPDPLHMQITGPAGPINVGWPGKPCTGNNCWLITITVLVDPIYADIVNNVTISGNPPLTKNPLATIPIEDPNAYTINLDVEYYLTVRANGICPTTQAYTFTVNGPQIININIFDSICSLDDGSVNMVMYYYNSDFRLTGLPVDLCFYMPSWNPSPLTFRATYNQELFLPTVGLGPDTANFVDLPPGVTNVWIYDICQGGGLNPTPNCFACVTLPSGLNSGTFSIQYGYLYTFRQFVVPTMASESGGIDIVLNEYIEAPCYGDSYYFSYSVYDDEGANGDGYPQYVIQFISPDGTLLKTFGCCVNTVLFPNCTGELPPAKPVGGGRVLIGTFNFSLSTGQNTGFGLSGNYTFVVKSCNSSCIGAYPIYIDYVNPILINLFTESTDCAYEKPALTYTVNGGAGFYSSSPALNISYYDPSTGLLIYMPYILCWYTPLSPLNCTQMLLPLNVVPGPYTLCATDRNGCRQCESVNVTNPPPITVELLGYDAYCETSSYAVATFNISGPHPPFYILEYLEQIAEGTIINITLYQNYSKSICFRVMDSVGCTTPNMYCFEPPTAGPINFTIVKTSSCPPPLQPTGTLQVITDESNICTWFASGIPIQNYNLCYQTNVPPGVEYLVEVQNPAGCSTYSDPVMIPSFVPIVLGLPVRTENGVLFGPCIDIINVTVSGGSNSPPYHAMITNPSLGMNLTIVNTYDIYVTGVCRGVTYVLSVSQGDYQCAVAIYISDPYYNTGSVSPEIPPPPDPSNDFFDSEKEKHGPIDPAEAVIISFSILIGVLLMLLGFFVYTKYYKK
jgi:hypothetical protein